MTACASPVDLPPTTSTAAGRFAVTSAVSEAFFNANADRIAHACGAMAECFLAGGRMFVCGDGAQRSDVAHVVVEFVHPVVVGKRALPTMPLPAIANGDAARAIGTLCRNSDILMLVCAEAVDESARDIVRIAQQHGLLTIVLQGSGAATSGDHVFVVPSRDPCIVQETHEILYHVLWELVHVFFEHRAVSA